MPADFVQQDGDLFICDGDFQLTTDAVAVLQDVQSRLRSFAGEWFLDQEGLPYFTDIWGKNVSYTVIHTIILETIVETPGVANIDKFELSIDTETRQLQVECVFRTIYDTAEAIELCLGGLITDAILDTTGDPILDTSNDPIRDTSLA